jgi:hypothetical protein
MPRRVHSHRPVSIEPLEPRLLRTATSSIATAEFDHAISEPLAITAPAFHASLSQTAENAYIAAFYTSILGRTPDSVALTTWSTYLQAGNTTTQLAAAIASTSEFDSNYVDSLYVQFLGRHADNTGLIAFTNSMRNGTANTGIVQSLLTSPEFITRAGNTPAGYVAALYSNLLDRTASTGEISYWVDTLNAGGTDATIESAIAGSPEARKVIVTTAFETFLGRNPDTTGLTYWTSQLAAGATQPSLIAGLVNSTEYLTAHSLIA